ncbi:Pkinase-domain-containing protein [Nadsonia fulvescens var. elongata DSM 6958]|uniref:non-specific serine/threonine protein kinase n=1 Tax=Nadsonia fulvescens var. elongata DSM 6958 TaxID=857566 RepID=A0A1E3PRX9_9ASCO|nr:Pkinase-domain-containing protein [Nadsonia fulvescens var. elongata DSM 6958]
MNQARIDHLSVDSDADIPMPKYGKVVQGPIVPMLSSQESHPDHHHNGNTNNKNYHTGGKPRSQKRRAIGNWDFIRTIGAGSMGQVKLGRNRLTGEYSAIKIVPMAQMQHHKSGSTPDTNKNNSNSKESDESKDLRTIRETKIGKLLHHPNICQLHEMYIMTSHYYMVFEYVSGGQLLDYIISHGSLKEKQARGFARGIASALDYCHQNSIVHRDLKIENILISETGDIKLIDFGLSNMYARSSLLNTFCGSLYFAAPELLNAKPYIGPEIDLWSFGVVIYVLVCGKVPFDDQHMPTLHAKIKSGKIEYPNWLSPECRDLLEHMLVVDPKQRATLRQVINHPWMLNGYNDIPVESHVPARTPLYLKDLDMSVVSQISDYNFSTKEKVVTDIMEILQSPEYILACENWSKPRGNRNQYRNYSMQNNPCAPSSINHQRANSKHFSFDFIKKRSSSISQHDPEGLRMTFWNSMPAENPWDDPLNGFDPLISLYFLIKEYDHEIARQKAVREQPTDSLSTHNSSLSQQIQINPPLPNVPSLSHLEEPPTINVTADYTPDDFPSMAAPAVPISPVADSSTHHLSPVFSSTNSSRHSKDSLSFATSLLRRFSSRRKPKEDAASSSNRNSKHSYSHSYSVASNKPALDRPIGAVTNNNYLNPLPVASYLGRSTSVSEGSYYKHNRRPVQYGAQYPLPNVTDHQNKVGLGPSRTVSRRPVGSGDSSKHSTTTLDFKEAALLDSNYDTVNVQVESAINSPLRDNDSLKTSLPSKSYHAAARAKSVSYVQRKPIDGRAIPPLPDLGNLQYEGISSTTNVNDNSSAFQDSADIADEFLDLVVTNSSKPRNHSKRNSYNSNRNYSLLDSGSGLSITGDNSSKNSNETNSSGSQRNVPLKNVDSTTPSIDYPKQLFMKGVFSVQTTSTKSLSFIRADIIRVLSQLGVTYKEMKGGFLCVHRASIMGPITTTSSQTHNDTPDLISQQPLSVVSSISGGVANVILPASPTNDGDIIQLEQDHCLSTDSISDHPTLEYSDMLGFAAAQSSSPLSSASASTVRTPLQFEIYIVKVPIISLHGVQFKKLTGNTWQYKSLATKILTELKL